MGHEELAELLASASIAVVPSLYEGFSLPAVEHMASGTPLVASRTGALPEVTGEAAVLVEPGSPDELAAVLRRLLRQPGRTGAAGRRRAAPGPGAVRLARGGPRHRGPVPGDDRRGEGSRALLTVDFGQLAVTEGTRVLDLGCGAGRHAFEALRRGAHVVALDRDQAELDQVTAMFAAMTEAGEAAPGAVATAVAGDATAMPFPDGAFDRVIAAEVLEHIRGDQQAMNEIARVLAPGGIAAVTVPSWLPERICWALSDDYHDVPGGHVRIYTRAELEAKLARAGLAVGRHHHAHGLHSPYWWLKCAVGVHDDDHPLARAYHRLLVWDIMKRPAATRLTERALNPLIGKSLVVYAQKIIQPNGAARTVAGGRPCRRVTAWPSGCTRRASRKFPAC